MKVPFSWLKDYIQFDQSPHEIADILTMQGLEVEAVETYTPSFTGVVVGKVVACEKHPDADALSVASVTDGDDVYQVVCGAPNCREGLVTAFCKVGGSIEGGEGERFEVKKAKIRGIESFGMLCSGSELKISEDHSRILELPNDIAIGSDLSQFYADSVLDIAITPNLGHCANLAGVARELSAVLQIPYQLPDATVAEEKETKTVDLATVKVEDFDACPRYACRVIEEVSIAPSPMWLQEKLMHAGIRPVNNVVDVTNFVLMETGQPLHAFDLDKVTGSEVRVRLSTEGEVIKTLDGKKRTCGQGFILICDAKGPIALGGVMGGEETEVSGQTSRILLESAYFNPVSVRKASKHYGLSSDASRRFERGCDPNQVLPALDRAASLIQQIAEGKVAGGTIDIKEREFSPLSLPCRVTKTNELLGLKLSPGEVEAVFNKLGFSSSWSDPDTLLVEVPTYRADVSAEIDLIEEVARIYGYDNIPKELASYRMSETPHAPMFLTERKVRERLVAEGLQEIITCDLVSPAQVALVENETIPEEAIIKVINPTSVDQSILRPSLMPGMLQVVKYNMDRQMSNLSLFEVGRIHLKQGDQFKEQSVAGVVLTGDIRPHHPDEAAREVDFYDLKGSAENLLASMNVTGFSFQKCALPLFHPGRQASFGCGRVVIGSLGEVHPNIVRALGISQRVYYAEFNLHDIMQVRQGRKKMAKIPQYPGSYRDWTITMVEDEPVESVLAAFRSLKSKLFHEINMIKIFRSDRIGSQRKNVTFRIEYVDQEKTVSGDEVDAEHSRLTGETLKLLGKAVI